MRIAQVEFEKKRAHDIIARSREEIAELDTETASLQHEIRTARPDLDALLAEKSEVERNVGAATARQEALEQEWNNRSEAVRELGIAAIQVQNELKNAGAALERAELQTDNIHIAVARQKAEAAAAAETIATVDAGIAEHQAALDVLRRELEELQARLAAADEETAGVRDEIHRLELGHQGQAQDRTTTRSGTLHEQELQLAGPAGKGGAPPRARLGGIRADPGS